MKKTQSISLRLGDIGHYTERKEWMAAHSPEQDIAALFPLIRFISYDKKESFRVMQGKLIWLKAEEGVVERKRQRLKLMKNFNSNYNRPYVLGIMFWEYQQTKDIDGKEVDRALDALCSVKTKSPHIPADDKRNVRRIFDNKTESIERAVKWAMAADTLKSFDFKTVWEKRLSGLRQAELEGRDVTDPGFPLYLLGVLCDLVSITERIGRADKELVGTIDQAMAVICGVEAVGHVATVKFGELMGFWSERSSRGAKSAADGQPQQRKIEGERRERTRLKIADFIKSEPRDPSAPPNPFKEARERIKSRTTKERAQSIDGLTDLDLLKSERYFQDVKRAFRKLFNDFLKQYEAKTGLKGKKREYQGIDKFNEILDAERQAALAGKPNLLTPS